MNITRIIALATIMITPVALAQTWNTIHLKPGQCVLIGNQQVCAMMPDATTGNIPVPTATPDPGKTRFACRYATHKEAEVSDVKTYAVIENTSYANGHKDTNFIKGYGMTGKAECEKDADARNAAKN